jgi:hypothetical protein
MEVGQGKWTHKSRITTGPVAFKKMICGRWNQFADGELFVVPDRSKTLPVGGFLAVWLARVLLRRISWD